MKLNSKAIGVILILIIFGGIGISKGLNVWKTESTKVPVVFKEGEFAGEYNPADIRGSYSFEDIYNAFNITPEVMARAFGLKDINNPSLFKVKDLEKIYGNLEGDKEIGTASVRYFVALYKKLPYEMGEEIYLPEPAVNILIREIKINEELEKYLSEHSIDISNIKIESNSSENNTEENNEKVIRGKTTFNEVIEWGISEEILENIINGKIIDKSVVIRDYCMKNGVEFSKIKQELQKRIDKKE
ncbi:hypothetical protein [Oceanirhabdus sp. W0125-5]|uniref:hypothetical protein n=1 Tax=Oceanirhabdus sp. W0125-5 TaxID=2999116 RepID=UPI0022F2FA60|nr:hypothetical protein [Oceanirhabdus sp. W0125-5]WBW99566.1 hypothetical protein OW730_12705 [Oceanirhabdus sp. W0125-5]